MDRHLQDVISTKISMLVSLWSFSMLMAGPARAQVAAEGASPAYKNSAVPAEARVDDLLKRLTLDEKIRLLSGDKGFNTCGIEHLGLPSFRMSDGPQGVRRDEPSPAYTAAICLAASWDTALAQKVGASYGRDARARGIHYLLAPGMNLYRAPMCGRNFEYYGEDPVLAGLTAAAFVRGVQSQGVAATVKHLAANNQEFKRHDLSSDVDERTLRELYLRGFQIAIREGQPKCVMDAYNPINGVHATQNSWLNNDVLKKEWGFRGLLMSDWESCYDTLGMAVGGLDLEMPSGKYFNAAKLKPLLDAGKVTPAMLDEKIRRQLRVAFEMGWFDRAQEEKPIPRDDPASTRANWEEAAGGITLLKNENNLLPLDAAKVRSVVVLGPNALPPTAGGGSGYVKPFHALGAAEGIRMAARDPKVVKPLLWQVEQPLPVEADGLETVRQADAVVICVGFNDPGCWEADHGAANEREDQDRRYQLPPGQDQFIARVAAVNPRTIVVLNAGGSVATASWVGQAAALLHAYYPGATGNAALGSILFGTVNPSGKLPFSWEKRWEDSAAYGNYPSMEHPRDNIYKEGILLGYRWFDARAREPLFPFGHGLSYTQFVFSEMEVKKAGVEEVNVAVRVHNSGARAGAEVVQVYAAPPAGGLPVPPRELKAYGKVFLEPGETKTVSMKIKTADLRLWDPASKAWTLTPGEYVFQAGDSSRALPLRASLAL